LISLFLSQDKISSSFILAEPEGFINIYNVEGLNLKLGGRERAHKRLYSISICKSGTMFFTAGEGVLKKYSSIKLWVLLSDSRLNELVELKIQELNIKEIFFVRETMHASQNKLSICVWSGSNKAGGE